MNSKLNNEDMIKEYILGKLPEEQAKLFEKELEKDSVLKTEYDELKKKEDLIRYYDSVQVSDERIAKLKKRYDSSRLYPVWNRGQVWKLHDLGWFLILAVNEQYQCRGIILNHNTHHSGQRDILFYADNIASSRLCAFTDLICTVTPANLSRYGGELNATALRVITTAITQSAAAKQAGAKKLPEGFTYGGDIQDEESDVWHEYMSDVCARLTSEALEEYEKPSDNQKMILDLISPHHRFDVSEPVMSYMKIDPNIEDFVHEDYEMEAASEDFDVPDNITLHRGDGIKVEAAFDNKHSAVKLIFTFIADDQVIKLFDLRQETVTIFSIEDIQINAQMAECLINDKAILARLAVLTLELIITTEKNTYNIKLDVRKS